jgi:hypothetical protein
MVEIWYMRIHQTPRSTAEKAAANLHHDGELAPGRGVHEVDTIEEVRQERAPVLHRAGGHAHAKEHRRRRKRHDCKLKASTWVMSGVSLEIEDRRVAHSPGDVHKDVRPNGCRVQLWVAAMACDSKQKKREEE